MNVEIRRLRKDGSQIDISLSTAPLHDSRGRVFGIMSVSADKSERKRAEEELKNSSNFLISIIEQNPFPMWISDDRGTLIKLNGACRRLLDITDEEVVGKYNVLEDDIVIAQGHLPLVKKVFEQGEAVSFEISYDSSQLKHLLLQNTVTVFLEVTVFPVKDVHGTVTNAVIQHHNITDRKLAEQALRQSEERFRYAADATNDGLWDWDIATDRGYFSPACFRMVGYSPDEFPSTGKHWAGLIHQEDHERVLTVTNDCIENRRMIRYKTSSGKKMSF